MTASVLRAYAGAPFRGGFRSRATLHSIFSIPLYVCPKWPGCDAGSGGPSAFGAKSGTRTDANRGGTAGPRRRRNSRGRSLSGIIAGRPEGSLGPCLPHAARSGPSAKRRPPARPCRYRACVSFFCPRSFRQRKGAAYGDGPQPPARAGDGLPAAPADGPRPALRALRPGIPIAPPGTRRPMSGRDPVRASTGPRTSGLHAPKPPARPEGRRAQS